MVSTASGWFVSQRRLVEWAANHPKWPAKIRPDDFLEWDMNAWFEKRWHGTPMFALVVQWPKPSPKVAGEAHLMLVTQLKDDPTGTRDSCQLVPKRRMDEDIEQLLLKDGLEGPLNWMTIPDPYEDEPYPYNELPPYENDGWAETD